MNTTTLQPDITLWGIRVQEPVTCLTDLIVTGVCFFAFYRLGKLGRRQEIYWFFRYYFLTMGIATLLGGLVGHGFLYCFPFAFKLPGWLTSMFSITLIERASIDMCRPLLSPKFTRALRIINVAELVIFVLLTFSTLNFFFVEVHSFYGLLVVVTSLQLYNYRKTGLKSSKMMVYAVGVLALASVVFMLKRSVSPWFNFIDMSHVLMAIAAFQFYRSVKVLQPEQMGPALENVPADVRDVQKLQLKLSD